jgi:hypothetical protein
MSETRQWTLPIALGIGLVGLAMSANGQGETRVDAPPVIEAANAWRAGEPIPAELRHYRRSPGDMPDSTDSRFLIAQVKNLALLSALSADLGADLECRDDAFVQGEYFAGPSRFFPVLARDLDARKYQPDPWLRELRERIAQPYVVVNALFIEDASMRRETTLKVLSRIEKELRAGSTWDTVYTKYADEFGYRTGNRTKIGNLGHLVIYADPALGQGYFANIPGGVMWRGAEPPRRLSRLAFFDAAHLPPIMRMAVGDVIHLHSSLYSEFILYQAEETYPVIR